MSNAKGLAEKVPTGLVAPFQLPDVHAELYAGFSPGV